MDAEYGELVPMDDDEESQEAREALDLLLHDIGIEKYVLFVVGEPCEHGCPHATMYSGRMSTQDIQSFLSAAVPPIVAQLSDEPMQEIDSSLPERPDGT